MKYRFKSLEELEAWRRGDRKNLELQRNKQVRCAKFLSSCDSAKTGNGNIQVPVFEKGQDWNRGTDLGRCGLAFVKARSGNCIQNLETGKVEPYHSRCIVNRASTESSCESRDAEEPQEIYWPYKDNISWSKTGTLYGSLHHDTDEKEDLSLRGLYILADAAVSLIQHEKGNDKSPSTSASSKDYLGHVSNEEVSCALKEQKQNIGLAENVEASKVQIENNVNGRRRRMPGRFQDSVLVSWKKKTRV